MIAYSTRAPGNNYFLYIIVMILMMRTKPRICDYIFNQGHCHTVISDLAQDLNISLRILSRKLTAYYLNILKTICPKIWVKVIQCFPGGLWELSTNLRFSPSVFIPFLPSRLFQLENCLCRLTILHSSLSTAFQTQPYERSLHK